MIALFPKRSFELIVGFYMWAPLRVKPLSGDLSFARQRFHCGINFCQAIHGFSCGIFISPVSFLLFEMTICKEAWSYSKVCTQYHGFGDEKGWVSNANSNSNTKAFGRVFSGKQLKKLAESQSPTDFFCIPEMFVNQLTKTQFFRFH